MSISIEGAQLTASSCRVGQDLNSSTDDLPRAREGILPSDPVEIFPSGTKGRNDVSPPSVVNSNDIQLLVNNYITFSNQEMGTRLFLEESWKRFMLSNNEFIDMEMAFNRFKGTARPLLSTANFLRFTHSFSEGELIMDAGPVLELVVPTDLVEGESRRHSRVALEAADDV